MPPKKKQKNDSLPPQVNVDKLLKSVLVEILKVLKPNLIIGKKLKRELQDEVNELLENDTDGTIAQQIIEIVNPKAKSKPSRPANKKPDESSFRSLMTTDNVPKFVSAAVVYKATNEPPLDPKVSKKPVVKDVSTSPPAKKKTPSWRYRFSVKKQDAEPVKEKRAQPPIANRQSAVPFVQAPVLTQIQRPVIEPQAQRPRVNPPSNTATEARRQVVYPKTRHLNADKRSNLGQMPERSLSMTQQASKKVEDANMFSFAPLAFYETQQLITSQLYTVNPKPGNASVVRNVINFEIPSHVIRNLSKSEDDPSPRHEVQLRFALNTPGQQLIDIHPDTLIVNLNNNGISLPRPHKTQSAQFFYQPIDLTMKIQDSRPQVLSMQWYDRREFVVGIWLVKHITSIMEHARLLQSGPSQYEETRAQIKKSLSGNSDDISTDSLKISLLCPLSRTRLVIPARSQTCKHLKCFDLANFLSMNEKKPFWKCPLCNLPISYNSLIIDRYFLKIIKESGSANEIEFNANGDWKTAEKKKQVEYGIDDKVSSAIHPVAKVKIEHSSLPSKVQNKLPEIEIITLDDSDDGKVTDQKSRKRAHSKVSSVGFDVITLE